MIEKINGNHCDEVFEFKLFISEQKTQERTLETCSLCVDSRRFSKHCLVAIGIKVSSIYLFIFLFTDSF